MLAELRDLARSHAPEAIKELARLATKARSETARIAAIRELLDRGFGKSTQFVADHDEAGGSPNQGGRRLVPGEQARSPADVEIARWNGSASSEHPNVSALKAAVFQIRRALRDPELRLSDSKGVRPLRKSELPAPSVAAPAKSEGLAMNLNDALRPKVFAERSSSLPALRRGVFIPQPKCTSSKASNLTNHAVGAYDPAPLSSGDNLDVDDRAPEFPKARKRRGSMSDAGLAGC